MFTIGDLRIPVIAAPMAGGPSTPALAAAAARAGGIGFLAGGNKPVAALVEQIEAMTGLFGVNLFVPGTPAELAAEPGRYLAELEAEAARYGVELPAVNAGDTDDWQPKLDYLYEHPVPLVSFTFGLPSADVIAKLHAAGTHVTVTVTDEREAVAAQANGADSLCVQGPDGGGHRSTHTVEQQPDARPLDELILAVRGASTLPLVAAGGISTPERVRELLALGVAAVQVGTMLLRSPESGAPAVHKDALVSGQFAGTTVTRAFTGRYARGLTNRFILEHDATAPAAYPALNQLTRPIRAASIAAGDAGAVSLWAGVGFAGATDATAEVILSSLAP